MATYDCYKILLFAVIQGVALVRQRQLSYLYYSTIFSANVAS